MNILYVDYYHEYGIKSRGLNYIGVDGFEKNLSDLGHNVSHFYFDDYLYNKSVLNKLLIKSIANLKPDLVFFNLYHDIIEINTIKEIGKIAITVNWFGDDPFLFDRFTKIYAPFFTYCITTDKYSLGKYRELGVTNIILSQWPAHIPDCIEDKDIGYKYNISFVGAKNPPREWFVNELRNKGLNIEVFGNGWPSGPVTNKKMHLIFAQSKINLNISNSDIWDYRFLFSGYCGVRVLIRALIRYHAKKNKLISKVLKIIKCKDIPAATFYGKTSSQIKARNFEIPICNGFQITDYVPSIEDYFLLGSEIVCYTSVDDAKKLIEYYLINEEERKKIKISGFKKAVSEYSYKSVLTKIFLEINDKK